MKISFLTALFVVAVNLSSTKAQVKFSVIADATEIGKDDYVSIEFKVENAEYIESIVPPNFTDFYIVSGPNQQRGMRSVNGKTDTYVSIGFVLQPKKTGTFTIGAATARADAKDFKTKPVTIRVTTQSQRKQSPGNLSPSSPFSNLFPDFEPAPRAQRFEEYILKPGENPDEKIKKNIFLKLDVSKTTCYVGEPITASIKIYSRLPAKSQVTEAPSFNGFSVSDLDFNRNRQTEKVDGRDFNVYELRKVQLYPMQPGDLKLSSLKASNVITFLRSDYANQRRGNNLFDLLQDYGMQTAPEEAVIEKNVELESAPVTIHVKPLPDKQVPAGFKGAVGQFHIEAAAAKNRLTTDDAGNILVTIQGEGNIQLVNAPAITWPEGVEGFEPRVKEELDKSVVPIRGTKIFTYPFTVAQAGEVTIAPVSFAYFDPESDSYKTVKTAPLTIQVDAGEGKAAAMEQAEPSESALSKEVRVELFFAVIGAVIILALLILFRKNQKIKKETALKTVRVDDLKQTAHVSEVQEDIPQNPLSGSHAQLKKGDETEFFIVLNTEIKTYLSSKFNIPIEEISRKRLHEEMDNRNIGIGTAQLVDSLLEEIEINLYSKSQPHHLQQAFEKASEVVALLNKQCNKIV